VVLVLMCTTLPRLAAEARWRPAAGTDACGNPRNLVQIQARLRDAIVLINSSPADDIPGCPHIRIAAACSATTVTGRRNSIKLLIVLDNVDLLRIGFRIIANTLL